MGSRKPSPLFRLLARWHRWAGLAAAVFLLQIALTGILINHGDVLEIDKKYVRSSTMLDWYGIGAPRVESGFRAGDRWISQVENRLYVNDREFARSEARLVAAVQHQNAIVLATRDRLYVLDAQGGLLESLGPEHGVPASIEALGRHGAELVLRAQSGDIRVDLDAFQWHAKKNTGVQWAQPEALPPALAAAVAGELRQHSLSWDRLIRDIHSGRILGAAGMWLLDVLAVLLILLSVTGVWVWWRARKEFPNKDKVHPRV